MTKQHPFSYDLAARIKGEVYADKISRYLSATDGSIFQQLPHCVVKPRDTADVMATVRFAAEAGLSVHARGAGSGVCGSALGSGVVLDFTKHINRLLQFDEHEPSVWCEPGFRLGELEVFLRGRGLFFPPDPSSGEYATFGGMFNTNASGSHSVKYGNVADYVLDAEVVFADGCTYRLSALANTELTALPAPFRRLAEIYLSHRDLIESAYPDIRYNTAGYNLRGLVKHSRLNLIPLLAGSEGTLGMVTRLKLRLLPRPRYDTLVVAFMPQVMASARAVTEILPLGPSGIEIMDKSLLSLAAEYNPALREKVPADVDNILLIEFDGPDREACRQSAAQVKDLLLRQGFAEHAWLAETQAEKDRFWAVRKAAVPTLFRLKGERKMLALVEDAAVPVASLPAYSEGIYAIFQRFGLRFAVYGHIAKGLLHIRPLLNLKSADDVQLLRPLAEAFFELVNSLGGSVSGEHGDGRLRSAFLQRQYPRLYPLFLETKRILDPAGRFNPEIITRHDPDQMAQHLRFGATYQACYPEKIHYRWPEGVIAEIEKCHGCSKCTTVTAATRMCPVYKATRDEQASPRAKANLLRGLISGGIGSRSGQHSQDVRAAIQDIANLCLNCGSCRLECPSGVDIPGLMAEVKAQAAARQGHALLDLLIMGYEPAARHLHRLAPVANRLKSQSWLRRIAEKTLKLSAQAPLPIFAANPLVSRFPAVIGRGQPSALYFSGCAAGYQRPTVGEAAISLLRQAGLTVYLPDQRCCGLPLLARGLAREARQKIAQNLSAWAKLLRTVDYLAVSCSSCAYMLTRQWPFLEHSPEIDLIRQKTILISRLLWQTRGGKSAPGTARAIAYHLPCHLKLLPQAQSSADLLAEYASAVIPLPDYCCGLAGTWGLLRSNAGLSLALGRKLLNSPAQAADATWVTDCPSCAWQIERLVGRQVFHPLEIIHGKH